MSCLDYLTLTNRQKETYEATYGSLQWHFHNFIQVVWSLQVARGVQTNQRPDLPTTLNWIWPTRCPIWLLQQSTTGPHPQNPTLVGQLVGLPLQNLSHLIWPWKPTNPAKFNSFPVRNQWRSTKSARSPPNLVRSLLDLVEISSYLTRFHRIQ